MEQCTIHEPELFTEHWSTILLAIQSTNRNMDFMIRVSHFSMLAAGWIVLWGAAMPVLAQAAKAGDSPWGQERLVISPDWDWSSKEHADELKRFQSLRKGEKPYTEADKQIVEHGAQWYAYRLTHSEFHDAKLNGKMIQDIGRDALDQVVDTRPGKVPKAKDFMEEFGKRFVVHLQEVSTKSASRKRASTQRSF